MMLSPHRRAASPIIAGFTLLAWALGLAFLSGCASQLAPLPIRAAELPHPIRLACVGDSITYGHLIPNRERDSFPAKLAALLGPDWQIGNFGRSGATLARKSYRPYRDQKECADALAFRPHVVIIQLGTNDTKREIWEAEGAHFVDDYLAMIRDFQALETKPKVIICLPVPLFRDQGKEWDTDKVLREQIIPRIQTAAQRANLPVLDLYALFADQSKLMPDGVHPNAAGADRMARAIHAALSGQTVAGMVDITKESKR